MAPRHRTGIILTGGIGDFITSLPALRLLRRGLPRSEILLAGNPLWLPLARALPFLDEVYSIDDLPLHAGFMRDLPPSHPLSRFLARFDLLISWFGDREGLWEKTVKAACPGRALVRPFHEVHAFDGHASDYYLSTLEALGLTEAAGAAQGASPAPILENASFEETLPAGGASAVEGPFLCLHPGSGSERKNWPKEDFLEVARRIFQDRRLPSVVLIGPAEEEQRTFWKRVPAFITVREGLPILEVARTLQRATLYLGNDSGITHLATALGVPVAALFGPTDPNRWGPRGGKVRILLQPASPGQVLSALGGLLLPPDSQAS